MIELREVIASDLEAFYEHQADREAAEMAQFPSRDRDAHFDRWRRNLARPDGIARTVIVDGEIAGNIVSWVSDGRRHVGYWIGREFWGRGVGTAALRALLDEIDERPLFADVATSNIGSIRVLEKCGFVRAADQPPPGADGVQEVLFTLD